MAQVAQQDKRYRMIGIAVAGTALLGWLLALYFWSVSNENRQEVARLVSLNGTAEEIDTRITAARSAEEEATSARDAMTQELDALSQQVALAQTEAADLDADLQGFRDERETLETELVAGREELAGIETGLTDAQNRVTATTQELSDVGSRLQDATQQEADLQSRIADLTSEVSSLTDDSAEAQQRIQTARDAEASLERSLLAAQQEQEQLESTRQALQASVDLLSEQREQLASDTLASEEQLQTLQTMTGELSAMLAERGAQLVAMEERIAAMLQDTGSRMRADASAIVSDMLYTHRFTTLQFSSDGTFQMENTLNNDSIRGDYTMSEGTITLSDAEGDLAEAAFPMTCGISDEETGFTFEDTDGSCALFDGTMFQRSDL